MARQNGKRSSQGMRNLQSAGRAAAKFTGRTTEKAAVELARWVTTDHLDIGRTLENMPSMGLIGTLQTILMRFLFAVAGIVLTGVWIFVLIAYGIPFLITGHF